MQHISLSFSQVTGQKFGLNTQKGEVMYLLSMGSDSMATVEINGAINTIFADATVHSGKFHCYKVINLIQL